MAATQPSEVAVGISSDLSYQSFVSKLDSTSSLRIIDSLLLQDQSALDGATIISEFALLLTMLRVAGPGIHLGIITPLGVGAHFTVFQADIAVLVQFTPENPTPQDSIQTAAIKKPNFLLDSSCQLDLSDTRTSSRHIRSILLEITALCHPQLRQHPNIVTMLGWGTHPDDWHAIPYIALELANMDLVALLQGEAKISPTAKLALMHGVASGLDAIHRVGLIHGDLKPANVLIFEAPDGWCAKLADFGGSAILGRDESVEFGGTLGWRAPEIRDLHEYGRALDFSVLDRADNFSYGLLLWSTFLRERAVPPLEESNIDVERTALEDLDVQSVGIPASLIDLLRKMFSSLLKFDPHSRAAGIEGLMNEEILDFHPHAEMQPETKIVDLMQIDHSANAQVHWNMPEIGGSIIRGLISAFKRQDQVPSGILHALIVKLLSESQDWSPDITRHKTMLELLSAAARQGQIPSKAMIFRVYEYYDLDPPSDVLDSKVSWIAESCAMGNFPLWSELQQIDPGLYAKSVDEFHAKGGFNHSRGSQRALSRDQRQLMILRGLNFTSDQSDLHLAAMVDDTSVLSDLLCQNGRDQVNLVNAYGETPLLKACKAGSLGNVLQLLSNGADASTELLPDTPGYLHWAFHFKACDVEAFIAGLIQHGAPTHSLSKQEITILYPPFRLPYGTALHWAVETSAPEAVRSLLRHGADPCLRDGRDPYSFDRNVRYLDCMLPPDGTGFCVATQPTMGLNAFDLAVQNKDHEILEILFSETSVSGISDLVDEEHYTALHRLESGRLLRTYYGTGICKRYFRGSKQKQSKATALTVTCLRDHGFNLDQLTRPQQSGWARQTPLMLAIGCEEIDTIRALLEAGANIDARDDSGRTVLHLIEGQTHTEPLARQAEMISVVLDFGPNINVQDIHGESPLTIAARRQLSDFGSALLARGADFCVRGRLPDRSSYGQNVLAAFCRCDIRKTRKHDEWMATTLTRHVFPQLGTSDSARHEHIHQEVFLKAGINGGNFLHFAAHYGLSKCCRLLLQRQLVDCNQLRGLSKPKTRDGVRGWLTGFRTPLDEAIKQAKCKRGRSLTGVSSEDFAELLSVFEETADIIRSYGGVRAKTLKAKSFSSGSSPPIYRHSIADDI